MLIDKKCDFITDHGIEYTGIIIEKYNGVQYGYHNLIMDYYIVDIGDKLKHLPCSTLVKIHNESVIDSKDVFNKAVEYVQENYCDRHLSYPYLLIGNVAELIEITTGKKVDVNVLAKYSK